MGDVVGDSPETRLVKGIRKALKGEWPDAYFEKIHGDVYQNAGVPDILGCVDGYFVGLEVKCQRPRESETHARDRATPHQRDHLRRISEAGGICGVVLSAPEALDLIRSGLASRKGKSDGD